MTKKQGLVAGLRPYASTLFAFAQQLSPSAVVTSVRRDATKQAQLYNRYITGKSAYPAAAPGTSKHERGLAFDLGGLSASQLRQLGEIWESWGGRWGGRFSHSDPIHFEA